ncbi:hypothetical protein SteCoe_6612 [Stentor coeruleus]|uniref:UBA domain-containing protein n=1 Tax=Stentor coeruleus TaxID=5963 RepID=A0A1R2CPM0_9CILI|nr:hypothetical protein SteCoe_6612 [Stentor coeruleus]
MNPIIKYYANSKLLTIINSQDEFIYARNALKKENSFFLIESQTIPNYLKDIPLVQSINENIKDNVSVVIDEMPYVQNSTLEIPEEEVIEIIQAGDLNIMNTIRMKNKNQDYEHKGNEKINIEKTDEIIDYKQNLEVDFNPQMQSSTFTLIKKSIGSFNHHIPKSQYRSQPQCAGCNEILIKTLYIQCQICINYQLCTLCTNTIHHPHPTKIINPSYELDKLIEKIKFLGFSNDEEILKALFNSNNNYSDAVKLLLSLD